MDARRIDRILRNLILNAVEHGEGKPVTVTVAANQTAVGVAVRDQGLGMTPAEAARVFDRFWRADPARARTTGGSGLGLSIAMEDTKLHNGWLQAWGNKGSGSNFRLTIPLRQGEEIDRSPVQLEPGDIVLPTGHHDGDILVFGPGSGPARGTEPSASDAGLGSGLSGGPGAERNGGPGAERSDGPSEGRATKAAADARIAEGSVGPGLSGARAAARTTPTKDQP
jgi:two-component system sensor histidine kinase MtrB